MNEIQEVARPRGMMGASEADLYRQRRQRFDDAVSLEIPDRVPLEIYYGYFPAKYCGVPYSASYCDCDTRLAACKKTVPDFGAGIGGVQPFFPGSILELVDPPVDFTVEYGVYA